MSSSLRKSWVARTERSHSVPSTGSSHASRSRIVMEMILRGDGDANQSAFHGEGACTKFHSGVSPRPRADGSLEAMLLSGSPYGQSQDRYSSGQRRKDSAGGGKGFRREGLWQHRHG